jgi:two-component system response regulator
MPGLPPIMLIDDEPDDLFIVRRLLAKAGVQNKIVAFEDPRGALDYLTRESENADPLFIPCVVITDFHMGPMTGVDVIKAIRANPRLSDTKIIMMSDSANPQDESAALAAGATRFVSKYPTSHGLKRLLGELPCSTGPGP